MSDAEIYTPKHEPAKMEERKTEMKAEGEALCAQTLSRREEMTPTAEKLYAIYDKARTIYRHLRAQNAIPEGVQVEMLEEAAPVGASDTKKDE